MFEKFKNKMIENGVSELGIKNFENNFNKMIKGESFVYLSKDIEPLNKTNKILENSELFSKEKANKIAVIKLNGGLGTSMGMKGPKSQLVVKNNLNFLEITVNQIKKFNQNNQTNVPLIFMNSFNTSEETEKNLRELDFINSDLPVSINQNKVPKIRRTILDNNEYSYEPAKYPQDQSLEWAPPGHADLYNVIYETGLLKDMELKGFEYLFISNIDNLGATLSPSIIEAVFEMNSSFVMEVAIRTENDKKGGHVALKNGKLILRESSQVIKEDEDDFQNYNKYKFFNTNSLWINIKKLREMLDKYGGILDLPIVINQKNINPTDLSSEKIIQLESGTGSAVALFDDAKTIQVPSERFIPVKNTSNLLYLLSDLVDIDNNFILHPQRHLYIDLKNQNYKMVDDFYKRFRVTPSLKNCQSLVIENDVFFNEYQELSGNVKL